MSYRMTDSEFDQLTDNFLDHDAIFYTAWMAGVPIYRKDIPTAQVRWNPEQSYIACEINPEFWEKLNMHERLFIFAHEMLHIILEHPKRVRGGKISPALNAAMDVVINHLLVDKFGFDRNKLDFIGKKGCWIDTVLGEYAEENLPTNESFEYYLNLFQKIDVPELVFIGGIHGQNGEGPQQDGELPEIGNGSQTEKELEETAKKMADIVNDQLPDELKEKLLEKLPKSGGKQAGTQAGNSFVRINIPKPPKKKTWEKVTRDILVKHFVDVEAERWAPRPRRVQHLPQDLYLPSLVQTDDLSKAKIPLFVYMDTSGSCAGAAERFYKASLTIPTEKFLIRFFCFDTRVYPVVRGELKGFGGTYFHIIEEDIQMRMKTENIPYPRSVFVITDGYGNDVFPQFPKRWHWFLVEYHSLNNIPQLSKHYYLKDFE